MVHILTAPGVIHLGPRPVGVICTRRLMRQRGGNDRHCMHLIPAALVVQDQRATTMIVQPAAQTNNLMGSGLKNLKSNGVRSYTCNLSLERIKNNLLSIPFQ